MTNADKIRDMTDEELAHYISDVFTSGYIACLNEIDKVNNKMDSSVKFQEYLNYLKTYC